MPDQRDIFGREKRIKESLYVSHDTPPNRNNQKPLYMPFELPNYSPYEKRMLTYMRCAGKKKKNDNTPPQKEISSQKEKKWDGCR